MACPIASTGLNAHIIRNDGLGLMAGERQGRLEGKVTVVTGAGAGIGHAMVERFAREGAILYVTDINAAAAERVAASLVAMGAQADAVVCDVTRGQDVTALFQRVKTAHGKLDVLVNNAGLNVREDFRHLSDADWLKVRETNLDGVVRMARDGFELMRLSGKASLINVASIMGQKGLRQLAAYSVTKGAVAALSRALAVEYAPFGIRVNTLSPGFVETALTERFLRNPQLSKWLVDRTALKRLGTAEDIANAALFLASDESAYCTGSELVVDGGMTIGV
jgi:NAD(P)-dependent dehydrogenase (short-subunit alcohol dehydrogenase family)